MGDIKKYTDIVRLGHRSTVGVLNEGDYITITEKLDGCFHYDTLITLSDGSKEKIGKIVNNKMQVEVMTFNFENNKLEPKKITSWLNHGKSKKFICMTYQSPLRQGGRPNKIICTEDHLFWTSNGWKEAIHLTSEDTIYTFMESLDYVQEQLILGTMLGDSSAYPTLENYSNERNRGIVYTHSNKQIEYSQFKNKILGGNYLKSEEITTGYGSEATRSLSICSKPINEMVNMCMNENNKKQVNAEWLQNINPISLAFWYMDDGSLSHNDNQKDRVNLHTEGFSEEENDLLINMLKDKFNIISSKSFYKDRYYKIILDTYSSNIFFTLIACYIPKCMQYKLPPEYQMNKTFWDYYIITNTDGLFPIKITNHKDIPSYLTTMDNYDLEIEDNNNYFAGGILVHNSNASLKLNEENKVDGFSRNGPVNESNTLRGYYNWIKDNIKPELLNPKYRYFGEYLASHKIQYKSEYYQKFYLFSIYDDDLQEYLSDDIMESEAIRLGLNTVPILYKGQYISFEHLMSFVGKSDMAVNYGEGIVVKNVKYKDKYGNQCFVKLVHEEFVEIQKQKPPKDPNRPATPEQEFANMCVTKARIDKMLHKLVDEGILESDFGIEDMRVILSNLGNRIYEDILKEESDSLPEGYEVQALRKAIGSKIPKIVKEIIANP